MGAARRGEHLQREPERFGEEVPSELRTEHELPGWGRKRRDALVEEWHLPNE